MRSIGLNFRSGLATTAVALPVFLIGYCLLLFFPTGSITTTFFALVIVVCIASLTLGMMQSAWTKKTYVHRLHKTTQALEELSLGKIPRKLARERYVLCSDIRQCSEDHTIKDCLNCELYAAQSDLEKIGVIVRTLGHNIEQQGLHVNNQTPNHETDIIDLKQHSGFIRRDPGYDRTK